QMLPVLDEAELERFTTLIPRERSAEAGVLAEHRRTELGGREAVYGPVVLDEPGAVAQALLADPVVLEAGEIALVLPPGAPLEDSTRTLATSAQHGLPHVQLARRRTAPARPACSADRPRASAPSGGLPRRRGATVVSPHGDGPRAA